MSKPKTPLEKLQELIKTHGNQSAAADALGIPRQHISDMLNGKRGFSEHVAGLLGFKKRVVFERVKP